jgi:MFS family permease
VTCDSITPGKEHGVHPGSRSAVSQKTAVAVVYVAAIFLSTMDTTIVNVALPTIGRAFSVKPTAVDAVSISYLVSLAVFVPASGWLGDRFGGKRTLLTAVAIFTIASALCGMATSLGELVLFRVLQGAGGGMLASAGRSVGQAMLLRAFPAGCTRPCLRHAHHRYRARVVRDKDVAGAIPRPRRKSGKDKKPPETRHVRVRA